MADYLEQGRSLVEKVRLLISTLRNSPTEEVTAALAVLCFSVATASLNGDLGKRLVPAHLDLIRNGLFIVSALLVGWTVYRVWKQAIPPTLPAEETRPSPIKGPLPFTREDGELFRGLGRKAELEDLLAKLLDDQIPLVVVMGESGAGKTSLLRAGLSPALEKRSIRLTYWEALPTNPAERLLHAFQAGRDGTPPPDLDGAIRALAAGPGRTVVVLDQFEQLRLESPTHQPLFEALKAFVTGELPPYRLTWVVAFRRDYAPAWLDFELSIPGFHPPMVSLRLFDQGQAQGVMATLAAASGFILDQELLTDLTQAAADRDGRVSPVDIGTAMLVLSGLALQKNKKHLGKGDYRFAGGAEGILTAYLSNQLERFGDGERQGVMKALLALGNLENNQRVAEGKTVDELSAPAQLPANRLGARLDHLASPHVRLLEKLPVASNGLAKYRLPHDRIVSSLRRLTGLILAEADQAQRIFENAYRAWLNQRSARFLLGGADLRKVLKNLGQLYDGALSGERKAFLQNSLRRRLRYRLVIAAAVLGSIVLVGFVWREYWAAQGKRDLAEWGLPSDLYDHQYQLRELELTAPISNLNWLHTNRLSGYAKLMSQYRR
jgi:hypothetical protein